MARPYLTSHGLYGGLQSNRHLEANNGHLCLIRNMREWGLNGNPITAVVPPSEEYYASAAAYGIYGSGETGRAAANVIPADGNQVTGRVKTLFDAMTVSSWQSGHKSCFMYWSRGFGGYSGAAEDASYDPWYCRNTTKTGNAAEDEAKITIGCGATWQTMRFNLHAFPLYEAGAAATTSSAKLGISLRLYNPSWMCFDHQNALYSLTNHRVVYAYPSGVAASGAVNMLYNVSAGRVSPPSFNTSSDPASAIDFTSTSVVNQGHANNYQFDYTQGYGSENNICRYDPWDLRHYRGTTSWLTKLGMNAALRYRPSTANAAYYADVSLPDAMVKKLMAMQYDGHGDFWLTVGPRTGYFFTSNQKPGFCAMMYFSRVELVLTVRRFTAINQYTD